MKAVRNRLRRLVASIMLAAMTSFVLHGGAAATHAHPSAPHQQHAHDHGRQGVAHDHGGGKVHVHGEGRALVQVGDACDGHDSAGGEFPCCGSFCAFALAFSGGDTLSAPVALAAALTAASQLGSGIDPNGLKRPPRPPAIA